MRLVLATGQLTNGQGWVCHICCRGFVRGKPPWNVLACRDCYRLDRRIGHMLGGDRFLPLGIHSFMNGASVPLGQGSLVRGAAIDQVVAMLGTQTEIYSWRDQELARMAAQVGLRGPEVKATQWHDLYPPNPVSCGYAYLRLLLQNYPWLIEIEPDLGQPSWLITASGKSDEELGEEALREREKALLGQEIRDEAKEIYRRHYEAEARQRGYRAIHLPFDDEGAP